MAGIDFYTVSHNINPVKEFICEMVQKNKKPPAGEASTRAVPPKRRGRPRAYQPDVALGKALDLFRKDGFAATSLDDLSAATGMNRPSLYGAFGDKRELYIKSYQRYRDDARAAMIDIFRERAADPQAAGAHLRGRARHLSLRRSRPARLLHGDDGGLRSGGRSRYPRHGAGRLCRTRQGVRRLLPPAKEKGELPESADPAVLAQLASATIHTIAIRARARVPRKELEAIVKGAIDVMCGEVTA